LFQAREIEEIVKKPLRIPPPGAIFGAMRSIREDAMKKLIMGIVLFGLLAGCELFNPPPPLLGMNYIGYTDYYNGAGIALKYDITNNANKTISHFRPEIEMTWKYGMGTQTYKPDVSLTIPPGVTIYSHWIPVAYGMVFYSSHSTKEALVWFDDGSQITVDHPE
jgi:hypothetical protein